MCVNTKVMALYFSLGDYLEKVTFGDPFKKPDLGNTTDKDKKVSRTHRTRRGNLKLSLVLNSYWQHLFQPGTSYEKLLGIVSPLSSSNLYLYMQVDIVLLLFLVGCLNIR